MPTKDEAILERITEVCRYDARWPDIKHWILDYGNAHAQAAVEEALDIERRTQIVLDANHDEGQYEDETDTLGLLEVLAKRSRGAQGIYYMGISVQWISTLSGGMFYYSKRVLRIPEDGWVFVTRDEVLALLAGKEKKE